MTTIITWPQDNQVIQHTNSEAEEFKTRWRGGDPDHFELRQGVSVVQTEIDGDFSGAGTGWFQLAAVKDGNTVDQVNVGIGDVFLVAGQSNSVSQRQPDSLVIPIPQPGKVIVSDYYRSGKGMFEFRDVGLDPLTEPNGLDNAGCAWVYCGMRLNRLHPVMFVLIGVGNSTGYDWAHAHVKKLFDAWAIHKPKAILWHQGESDCTYPPRDDSFTMLNAIVESLRNVTTTPWVISINSTSYPPPAPFNEWPVRQAQRNVVANWAHVYEGPDTDVMRVTGEVEYLNDSISQHGEAQADRLLELGF